MKRKIVLPVIGVMILAIGGASAWFLASHREKNTNTMVLYGNVDIREVQLAFNGSDRIAQMTVHEGERVTKGQLLATLDRVRLAHTVELQRAQLAAQQQVVDRMEAGSRPEEIRKAEADTEAARINAENAESNYQRAKTLAAQHFVAQQQADDARARADAARAQYHAADEALKLIRLGPRHEDIEAAKALLHADRAALEVAQKALADASLYAPENGVIEERLLEPGDLASPQRPVYTLALTDPLWVRAYVPEKELGRISPDMSAEVTTDSYPGKRYRAWVGYISPTAEFTPKAVETPELRSRLVYQVRIFVCNPQNELRLGMPATVSLALDQPPAPDGERCRHP